MEVQDEPTACQPKDIKRVAKDTVHKICSSQVILNIAVAVKELVENSVDAGAKIVEIKIRNYGVDGFEVNDNGTGITEENFAGITAKHHTSKLKEFSDLESIKTFGFRGEALSSLCALSNVSIITRHSSTEHGTRLIYDHDGNIIKKTICARNVGTTVAVNDFFTTLPVRRGEFLKNYKKDFAKMVQLIQEYCLVLTGVKIICTNQPPNGPKQIALSTQGASVLDNIISIFTAKQTKDLIKIRAPTEDGTDEGPITQQSLADPDGSISVLDINQPELDRLNQANFKIEGFISEISSGRTSKDRQFFYINSRPVELRAISKLINDVYHRYNPKQFPFIYLNLKMNQSGVDVNLSKDKRQVAVCDDKMLQLVVKRSLLNTYGDLPSKFRFVSVNNSVKHISTDDDTEEEEDDKIMTINPGSKFGDSLRQWKVNPKDPTPVSSQSKGSCKRKLNCEPKGQREPKIKEFFHQQLEKIEDRKENESWKENSQDLSFKIECKTRKSLNTLKFEVFQPTENDESPAVKNIINLENTFLEMSEPLSDGEIEGNLSKNEEKSKTSDESFKKPQENSRESSIIFEMHEKPKISDETSSKLQESSLRNLPNQNLIKINTFPTKLTAIETSDDEVILVDSYKSNVSITSSKIKTSLAAIKALAVAEEKAGAEIEAEKKQKKLKLRFKESKIDPTKNKKAEAELETEIKKENFKEMQVLGQFNLGFIIAKLQSDLFIVDQHASDEKFNFEDLEKKMKLQTQPLVVPEKLELSAIQEITLMENLEIFEMNGFKFIIDEAAEASRKIKIISKPFSKNWEFGREDIEEMIFMLDESPNMLCRPSRIRTMLASRACRKSIMIGTALTKKQMKTLLEHMGELDHPWNCPHGRPTLRYLQNLDFIDGN